ncbi:hypothetical protein CP532_3735 [Ophiocordyceps camponoti-leonardi (nom. inval.)]|nr:hypothetical protein CP532_3735 [Ophiocordyceps camponoti-leonardi (nom. inval.)]
MFPYLLSILALSRVIDALHYFSSAARNRAELRNLGPAKIIKLSMVPPATTPKSRHNLPAVVKSRNLIPSRIVYHCDNEDEVNHQAAQLGFAYLYAKDGGHAVCHGRRSTQPGIAFCVRISCSSNTAIYWCLYAQAMWTNLSGKADRVPSFGCSHGGITIEEDGRMEAEVKAYSLLVQQFAETRINGGRAYAAEYDNAFITMASAKC